jgi:hypothetical protein
VLAAGRVDENMRDIGQIADADFGPIAVRSTPPVSC